ncbi:MAG: hypothetical protein HY360_18875 [Verrucomicrobia bacterium]|nr:hypothetical protein [Verrucomicrobiota bacterium]
MNHEWTADMACEYWPDQRGHWAPVSWKDHLYDFNVFHDGTIAANPAGVGLNRNVAIEDQVFAAELRVLLLPYHKANDSYSYEGSFRPANDVTALIDFLLNDRRNPDGLCLPSWEAGAAPVYVIEHVIPGVPVKIRQKQFAHVPGGSPVRRGDEPHYLWVRFEVADVIEMINHADRITVCLTLTGTSATPCMAAFNNIQFQSRYGVPHYPTSLAFVGPAGEGGASYLRLAPTGRAPFLYGKRNRLGIPGPQKDLTVAYLESSYFSAFKQPLGHLLLSMPCAVGATIDFVFPISPVDDAAMDRELALGYDAALAEARRFWTRELKTRTSIRLSESLLQGWVDHFPRLEAMIAEKHPETGDYGLSSGSYVYEAIWATPMAMAACALEFAGYGREVEKYLETFLRHQGTIEPPSPCLKKHPGYFGSPKTFTSIDWLTDHGAILWTAANHGLLAMDRAFLRRWEPAIIKACEFIRDARRVKGHQGYPGIMPPGVANDCGTSSQTCWGDAWNYKALSVAAALLRRTGNARASEFMREAEEYRNAFQSAYRDVIAKSKTWKTPDGTILPFTPPTLSEAKGYEAAHAFNLDTGACVLVFGGLFPASDPIMQASLRWLREGPQTRLFREFASPFQTPMLVKEISSCEPCYSWNLFHTFDLGDRERFSMGLYSLFAAGACRRNFVSCETREGVSGNCFTHGLALMLLRMSVVHEEADALHLLRMTPLRFFREGGFEWKNVATWFGEISIAAHYDDASKTLQVRYRKPSRSKPGRTILHLPSWDGISRVILNGKPLDRNAGSLAIS